MKTLIVGSLVVVVIILGLYFTSNVDIVEMTKTEHVLGYWERTLDRLLLKGPNLTVSIPRIDGHYIGNPSAVTFYKYISQCFMDSSYMNLDKYTIFIANNK